MLLRNTDLFSGINNTYRNDDSYSIQDIIATFK